MRTLVLFLLALAAQFCCLGAYAQEVDAYGSDDYEWEETDFESVAARPWVWGRVEYLLFFSHGRNVPPLASVDAALAPPQQAGVLPPFGNAQVAFGDRRIGNWIRNGGRLTVGAALDADGIWGVEARYLQLEQSVQTGHLAADGAVLARPFFRTDPDPSLTHEDALQLTAPGLSRDGRIDIKDVSDYLSGDVNARAVVWDDGAYRFDALAGYQHARIDNSLEIRTSQVVIGPPLAPPPLVVGVYDLFDTQNRFNGGQIGGMWSCYTDRVSLELGGRLGFGNMHEKLFIAGTTSLTQEGTNNTITTPGGFLASSNSGTYTRDRFAFAPEFDANLVYHWRPRVSFTVGYTFVYWNRVAMAGNNIDRTVNLQRLSGNPVGEERPAAFFHETDFWVMGLNLGLESRF